MVKNWIVVWSTVRNLTIHKWPVTFNSIIWMIHFYSNVAKKVFFDGLHKSLRRNLKFFLSVKLNENREVLVYEVSLERDQETLLSSKSIFLSSNFLTITYSISNRKIKNKMKRTILKYRDNSFWGHRNYLWQIHFTFLAHIVHKNNTKMLIQASSL